MRKELGKFNDGTHAEVRFFLERNSTGEIFYVRSGPRGDKRLTMKEAVDQPFYQEARSVAQNWSQVGNACPELSLGKEAAG